MTVHPPSDDLSGLAAREAELNRREAAVRRLERARAEAVEGSAPAAPAVHAKPDEATWWAKQLGLPVPHSA